MSVELASAAFRYALRGVAIFPLVRGQKVPVRGSHGCRDGSTDCDVARARWKKWPGANIAAATGRPSGFWVLDVDAHHDGDRSLAELEAEHGKLPPTVQANTPSGGTHLYFNWPADGPKIRNSTGRIAPGIDVRGEGGSITLPPSQLADGRCYRWAANGVRGAAWAPAWLLALATPAVPSPRREPLPPPADTERYVAAAITSELNRLAETAAGQRNDQLNRSAFAIGGFVRAGLAPEDWARKELEARALAIGLPAIEASRTINSAFKAAQPRSLPQ